ASSGALLHAATERNRLRLPGEPRPVGRMTPRGYVRGLRTIDADMSPNWESVYRDNVEPIYRLMFSRVGNRPDAEDLTSEVFRTALRPLRLSASDPEIRSYLRATAQTVLASHWRRRFGIEVTTLNPDSELPDAVDDVM